jgi:two-component system, NtrC family, sensor histidine kinase KinB
LWQNFKKPYAQLDAPDIDRAALYRQDLFPRLQEMKTAAQQIADINMNNMVSVNGQVKRTMMQVRTALVVLVIAGILLATLVVWTTGAAMLRSLGALTRSARQIEAGDLDLTLQVKSRDELGLLAEAFNSMAARLREFRRHDLDRLARTQQTTQLAIDSLPDAVFVIGPDQKVEIANLAAKSHFNIEPGATVSSLCLRWLTPLYESITLDHKPIAPVGYGAALQLFDQGEERFLLPHAVPMLGKNQDLIGVTVILVDVTSLYRTDEAKSNMLLTVSHELRTPLTSMRMAIGPTTQQQEMLIKTAGDESNRLNRIIENLLNLSRLEAGRAQLQFRPMTISEIVATAIDPLRPGFAEKNISLQISLAPEIGEVNADPIAINSALTNLLSNAMKFTPTGGQVKITADKADDKATIQVADTGPGIPPQYRNKIFEKFFRVPNETGPTGAGLGLAIATEIIQAHGGQLSFTAPETGGTTFNISLPIPSAT